MTTPTPPQMVAVPAPLQWGIATGQGPDGSKVCIVQLIQANLATTVNLAPQDVKRLAADLAQAARQSETALIIPTGAILNGNH